MEFTKPKNLLVISQVYPPDAMAVGQHTADAAEMMVKRGWSVTVLTSDRGYDDPSVVFPRREVRNGVEVVRLPMSSLGKKTIWHRLVAQASFLSQATLRSLLQTKYDAVMLSTSPPLSNVIGGLLSYLRGVPSLYWVLDLNPDQAIEMGVVRPDDPKAKLLDLANKVFLAKAAAVVTMDEFMGERLKAKVDLGDRLHVVRPWPLDDHLERVSHDANPFRKTHADPDQRVVMYSGNHSLVHPLDTLLEATEKYHQDSRVRFLFVGGGNGKRIVDEFISNTQPANVVSLPYQPLEAIKYSLSAGDIHVVSIGDKMVGCVHPCKAYGALRLGKPVIVFGPDHNHLSDFVKRHRIGWIINHGDVNRTIEVIDEILNMTEDELAEMGVRAQDLVEAELSKTVLCGRFCDVLEGVIGAVPDWVTSKSPDPGTFELG